MKKLLLLITLISANIFAQSDNFIKNEILVQFTPNTNPNTFQKNVMSVRINDAKLISSVMNIWKLSVDTSSSTEKQIISKLYESDQVIAAQLNRKISLRETTPNDEFYDKQWQYYQPNDKDIDADLAWDVTTGGQNTDGDDIVVAVIDDGLNINHPDMIDNLWQNPGEIPDDGIDNDGNGLIDDVHGWSFRDNSNNVYPEFSWHGSPVSGIIGAVGNNGIGVTGINWNVKIMTIINFGTDEAGVIQSYDYALQQRIKFNESNGEEGAFVVATNSSWGIDEGQPDDAPLWCAFYNTMGEHGILSAAATANANFNIDEVGDLPTACSSEYLISVTNTNKNDEKETSAGYGLETIDLGAPGSGTYTISKSNYESFGGTSGATPHVTGTIALLYSAPCKNLTTLTKEKPQLAAQKIRDFILEGVDPNPSLEGITVTGGRLNVNNAIQLLMANCETMLGVYENNLTSIDIYPNPANNLLNIKVNNNDTITNIEVYGMDGGMLKPNFNKNTLNVSNLPTGIYTLKIKTKNNQKVIIKKFVKK